MMKPAYVYVIGREQGPVKIGIASNPWSRLTELQTGCPFRLNLLHARRVSSRDIAIAYERNVHETYAECRLMGEWFKIDSDTATDAIETKFEADERQSQRRPA
jgi:predicted GIY-YIG superfamily endonuclease